MCGTRPSTPDMGCGGVRVGEVPNPGPPQLLRRYRGGVGRNVVPRVEASWRQTQVNSDDQLLPTAPVANTSVDNSELAAFDLTVDDSDEVGDTAPASSGALREVGAQMVVPDVHRMYEEEVPSTIAAAPFLAPSNTCGSAIQVCVFDCGRWSSSQSEVGSSRRPGE